MLNWKNSVFALSLASALALPMGAFAGGKGNEDATKARAEANAQAQKNAVDAQDQVIEEALNALEETAKAVKALAEGKNDEAAEALERAIGKLEVVTARDPSLALAPVDVSSTVVDILATPDEINAAKREALRLMKDHELQLARPIVSSLASEVQIKTTYIPLGSYPLALKSAAALLKDGKVDEAKQVLAHALSTLVVDETIVPLPILRAAILIKDAKDLSEKADRTDEENQALAVLLDAIDLEIARGEALEYGGEDAFEPLKAEMKEVRKKLAGGGSGEGVFDKLKGLFEDLGREHEANTQAAKQ